MKEGRFDYRERKWTCQLIFLFDFDSITYRLLSILDKMKELTRLSMCENILFKINFLNCELILS